MKRYFIKAVLIILILLAAVSVVQGVKNALLFSQDFQYDAALALRSGINPYEESLHPTGILSTGATADFYDFFEERGIPQKMEANQFPSLLMLLFPMTLLPYSISRVLWLFLNLVFTALSVILLRKTFLKEMDKEIFYILMLLMIAGTPWRNQIGVGQHTLFSLFFFLIVCYNFLASCDGMKERRDRCSLTATFCAGERYTCQNGMRLWIKHEQR